MEKPVYNPTVRLSRADGCRHVAIGKGKRSGMSFVYRQGHTNGIYRSARWIGIGTELNNQAVRHAYSGMFLVRHPISACFWWVGRVFPPNRRRKANRRWNLPWPYSCPTDCPVCILSAFALLSVGTSSREGWDGWRWYPIHTFLRAACRARNLLLVSLRPWSVCWKLCRPGILLLSRWHNTYARIRRLVGLNFFL